MKRCSGCGAGESSRAGVCTIWLECLSKVNRGLTGGMPALLFPAWDVVLESCGRSAEAEMVYSGKQSERDEYAEGKDHRRKK